MRTIETTVYEFDELSEKAQEKALEKFYDINIDYDWYEFSIDDFVSILNTIGIDCTVKDIQFSGFYSQGDGLSFTGHYSYSKGAYKKIVDEFPRWTELHKDVQALQDIQSRHFYRISGDIYRIGHFYSHENTVKFGYSHYSDEVESELTEIFRDIMQEFYRHLEKEYEYLTSREAIIETIKCNEYEFDEFGNLV